VIIHTHHHQQHHSLSPFSHRTNITIITGQNFRSIIAANTDTNDNLVKELEAEMAGKTRLMESEVQRLRDEKRREKEEKDRRLKAMGVDVGSRCVVFHCSCSIG